MRIDLDECVDVLNKLCDTIATTRNNTAAVALTHIAGVSQQTIAICERLEALTAAVEKLSEREEHTGG